MKLPISLTKSGW